MSEDKRILLKQWLASGNVALQPLTFQQRELWETSPVPVADPSNHIRCIIDVQGVITPQACEAALQRVVERQEVLRTSFLPGKERAVQMIRGSSEANFRFRELTAVQEQEEALKELTTEIFREPFDLVSGPLYRAELIRRSPTDHVLAFAIHHATADGWTLGVFVEDLSRAYLQGVIGMRAELPPVALTYSDWGAAERAYWQPAELEKRAEFWRSHLAGRPRLWNSLEGPQTASGPHDQWITLIPKDLADATQALARSTGATLYSTLLAAFRIALSRWTGHEDLVVGTPIANRNTQSIRGTMGYCSTIVPLRVPLDPGQSFSADLHGVHQTTVDCFANAMPFAELASALGETSAPGHNPVFEVRFALQNQPMPDVALHGLSFRVKIGSSGTARFHIGCEITIVPEGLEVGWLFRPKLFPKTEIESLSRIFMTVLESVCRSPDSRVASVIT